MGNGVFTSQAIAADTVIEVSPVIVMKQSERKLLDQTLLHDYIFEWGDNKRQCCVALGYVSLYNHSFHSNCEYEMEFGLQVIRIIEAATDASRQGKLVSLSHKKVKE